MAKVIIYSPSDPTHSTYYEYDPETDLIGNGGMGNVFHGIKWSTRGARHVAIKALHLELTPETLKRAKREASIHIKDDHVVWMEEYIEQTTDNGPYPGHTQRYVISEYLCGVSLADVMIGKVKSEGGTIIQYAESLAASLHSNREKTAKDIILKISRGVARLHDANYIHRDIDPSNVMVTSNGRIVLIDFGIAKPISEMAEADKQLTHEGVFMGKITYAAPELILGNLDEQGKHTDVYSLAVLYYVLLVGRPPFGGSGTQVMQGHLKDHANLSPILAPETREIIKKALSKNPKDRYQSAFEFIDAIENPTPPPPPCWLFIKQHGRKVIVGLLAVLMGILAYVYWPILPPPPPPPPPKDVDSSYLKAMRMIDSENGIVRGMEMLDSLGRAGCVEAKYLYAYVHMWTPDDIANSLRKKRLHIKTDQNGCPIDSTINSNVVRLLTEIVTETDSQHPKALYYLGMCYANQFYVQKCDLGLSRKLLLKAKEVANTLNDSTTASHCEGSLKDIDDFEKSNLK